MYQLLLTRKYLTSKIMPMLAAISLALCTALVLTVWSVMGGFLQQMLTLGRTFQGDVTIVWPSGIAHYEDLLARLEKDPMVQAATPCIQTYALIRLPDDRTESVLVWGVQGESYARVVEYGKALWWRKLDKPLARDVFGQDPRLARPERMEQAYREGLRLARIDPVTGAEVPGVVLGIEAASFVKAVDAGYYEFKSLGKPRGDGTAFGVDPFLPNHPVTLNLLPLDSEGRMMTVATKTLPVVNEVRTGVHDLDKRTVFIQFEELQRLMRMDSAPAVAPSNGGKRPGPYENVDANGQTLPSVPVMGRTPARATHIVVKAAEGVSAEQLQKRCEVIYGEFANTRLDVPVVETLKNNSFIRTMRMMQGGFIEQIEQQTAILLFLFWFITLVCSVLVLAIFWSMVSEKTRDIGILRAIGASRMGICGMWLNYGLLLGVFGALSGLVLAALIVWNINAIHQWVSHVIGLQLWDPKQLQLSKIPDEINPWHALIAAGATLVFAVLGALIPAIRAAMLRPVSALRFE